MPIAKDKTPCDLTEDDQLNREITYYVYGGENGASGDAATWTGGPRGRVSGSERVKAIIEYNNVYQQVAKNLYGKGIDEILWRLDCTVTPNVFYHYQHDHEGSVTHVTDGSGVVIESYRYDAFGAVTIRNSSGNVINASAYGNRFMFTGREYAQKFGVYEYRNRAYDPGLGRFMSEDPKLFVRRAGMGKAPEDWSFGKHPDEAEYNLFRYCGNDPVDWTDPFGLEPMIVPDDIDVAARVAALRTEALYNSATTEKGMERNIAVVTNNSTGRVSLTGESIGWRDSSGKLRSAPPKAPEGSTRRASAHNHPNGTRLSGEDRVAADKRGEPIYARGSNTERWRPDDDAGKRENHQGGIREVWSERTKSWVPLSPPPLPKKDWRSP